MEVESEKEGKEWSVEDIHIGEEVTEETESEKYLGDIISKDGRNIRNIKARVDKGK